MTHTVYRRPDGWRVRVWCQTHHYSIGPFRWRWMASLAAWAIDAEGATP